MNKTKFDQFNRKLKSTNFNYLDGYEDADLLFSNYVVELYGADTPQVIRLMFGTDSD